MYCIKCGVKLAPSEKKCPLCGTVPFHPDLEPEEGPGLYPPRGKALPQVSRRGTLIMASTMFLIALIIPVQCDLQISGRISWSGCVIGALILGYVGLVLPLWFRRPNPVVFVPVWFGAAGAYLLYINCAAGGHWFLSFAFPVTAFLGLLVTALTVLLRCLRRGRLYIFGGALAALGIFMPVMELLLVVTFDGLRFVGWSMYPLSALVLLGGMLIFLAICRPARETMERKIFL